VILIAPNIFNIKMKYIKLNCGYRAIVDNEDFEKLKKYKWVISGGINKRYAVFWKRGKSFIMHRIISNTPKHLQTDHINNNGLDNRKLNLRMATFNQNQHNRTKQRNNTTGYKGVVFLKKYKKYIARIKYKGKSIYLGHYETARKAGLAYNKASLKYFGEYSHLNRK
jgi:hypothetical protein